MANDDVANDGVISQQLIDQKVGDTESIKTSSSEPVKSILDNRNTISKLTQRTFDYMGTVLSAMGPGQCLPGIKCWKSSMEKFNTFENEVNASNFDADKKKHAITCAKISSIIKGVTGSSSFAYLVTMSIGLGKEVYDKSFLNPTGGRDYLDLDADAYGAKLVYADQTPEVADKTLDDVVGTDQIQMDEKYTLRVRNELDSLLARYYDLLGSGNGEDMTKAQDLYNNKIVPIQETLKKIQQ